MSCGPRKRWEEWETQDGVENKVEGLGQCLANFTSFTLLERRNF